MSSQGNQQLIIICLMDAEDLMHVKAMSVYLSDITSHTAITEPITRAESSRRNCISVLPLKYAEYKA